MKWMIASDIHGSACYARQMLDAFDREGAHRLLLLGDILYHGPRNDLPAEYNPKEVIALLNPRKSVLCCVRGNCDTEVDQMVLDFPILADYLILPVNNRLIYATHGHRFSPKSPLPMREDDILLNGHTHIPAWEAHYWNPGSVSIPKNGSARGYMILTEEQCQWKSLDGEVIHTIVLG